jgi:hypothetical protein
VLQKWVRAWFVGAMTLPESFDDLHPDLLPIVRTRSYFVSVAEGISRRFDAIELDKK